MSMRLIRRWAVRLSVGLGLRIRRQWLKLWDFLVILTPCPVRIYPELCILFFLLWKVHCRLCSSFEANCPKSPRRASPLQLSILAREFFLRPGAGYVLGSCRLFGAEPGILISWWVLHNHDLYLPQSNVKTMIECLPSTECHALSWRNKVGN